MVLQQWLEQTQQQFEQHQLSFGHGTDNAWDEAVQLACFVLQLPIDVDRSVLAQPLTKAQRRSYFCRGRPCHLRFAPFVSLSGDGAGGE